MGYDNSDEWRAVVDVNLIGVWNTCAAALPHVLDRAAAAWSTSALRERSKDFRYSLPTRRQSMASSG